jgi:tol-pal system protein YbgF
VLSHCSGGTEQVRADVKALRDEVDELKRNQAATRVQYDEMRQRLVSVETRTAAVERPDRERHDEGWIPKLTTVRVDKPAEVVAEAPRPAEPKPSPVVPPVSHGGPADDVAPQSELADGLRDPVTAYERAKGLVDSDHGEEARPLFEQFLGHWPRHELADNALYWLGETYRKQALWTKAAQCYLRVRQDYPRANKVPDALLQLGTVYRELGDNEGAQEAWGELTRRYPHEPSAKTALKRLALLQEAKP